MGIVCQLENDLIDPKKWRELYDQMPKECRDAVDEPAGCPTGIGRNDTYGWFIMMSGQGPCLVWSEHPSNSDDEGSPDAL